MRLSPTLAASTAIFYALGYPVGALSVRYATPGVVLIARFVLGALILAAIVGIRRLDWPRGRQAWHAVVIGLTTQGMQFVGCYEAMYAGVSPVLVALVIAMNPVITAALASLLLRERLSARRICAVVIAFAAVCAAFAGRVADVGHIDLAVVWVIVAVIGLAFGGVYQQRFMTDGHPMAINAIGAAAAVVPAGVFAALTTQHITNTGAAIGSIAVLVIANSVIAASLYLAAIRRAGASAVSLLFGVIPSIAALLTWAILAERPDIGVIVGLVLGAAACALGNDGARAGTRTQPDSTSDNGVECGSMAATR
ncbi:hypothetical protein GOEFS_049_00400 [Gordonia effusa NBRC 100432]|uniref:EamA domain-containing protein n=1 Tax=Gordonia effusa NBRC 100432 TaxID=1077974 RepID=H0QZG8_9ACTN|nr:DMT family transporter [Gordonia effusa]GAB18219.1 hypothetical protein GOEFS_049_00400 [Gordonia effusa NBRC 100432]